MKKAMKEMFKNRPKLITSPMNTHDSTNRCNIRCVKEKPAFVSSV